MLASRPAQYTSNRLLTPAFLAFLSALCGITSFPTPSPAASVTLAGESVTSWMDRLRAAVANTLPALDLLDDGADAWTLLVRTHGVFLSQGWRTDLPAAQVTKLRGDLDTALALLGSPPEGVDRAAALQAAGWITAMRAGLDEVYP